MYKCQRALKLPTILHSNLPWAVVDNSSSSEWKKLLYTFAKCFTKEFEFGPAYDYLYGSGSKYQAYIFIEEGEAIGGCAFHRILEGSNAEMPVLQWAWLISNKRNKGYFQNLWNCFTEELDMIALGCPISNAMQSFIKKQINFEVMTGCDLTNETGRIILKKKTLAEQALKA